MIHPGEILLKVIMEPRGLTVNKVAPQLGLSMQRLNKILKGERGITEDTDFRLCKCFYTPKGFWLDIYKKYKETQSIIERFKSQT